MRVFFYLFGLLIALSAEARWVIQSEFQLHLNETIFDRVIEDFWQSLQGKQNIPIQDISIAPGGIPIQIQGIRAELDYAFPLPTRIPGVREWALNTNALSAALIVDRISASQTITREIDGILIEIRLDAECRNIRLKLPQGNASISAHIRAQVAQSQVQLSLPSFDANWREGSWVVEGMNCTGAQGFDKIVAQESLKALSSFQNFDAEVRASLEENFAKWSKDASKLLLSENQLPSGKDYLNIFYEPRSAVETGAGLMLRGEMRFEYPFVAQGQEIEQHFSLILPRSSSDPSIDDKPTLQLPFDTVRSLIMGEYFAGKLEYSLWSNEIPAFQELMKSRWTQFFVWPHLMNWPKNTKFAMQFLPIGPPSFTKESPSGNSSISGELNLPIGIRMYAPVNGVLTPMVEFRSLLAGQSNITLLPGGKAQLQINANELPVAYGWSKKYVANFAPSERIAAKSIASAVKDSLNANGLTISLPPLNIGKSLLLKPESWTLEGKSLRLKFDVGK